MVNSTSRLWSGGDGAHSRVGGGSGGVEVDGVAHGAVVDQMHLHAVTEPSPQHRPHELAVVGHRGQRRGWCHLEFPLAHGEADVMGPAGLQRGKSGVAGVEIPARGLGEIHCAPGQGSPGIRCSLGRGRGSDEVDPQRHAHGSVTDEGAPSLLGLLEHPGVQGRGLPGVQTSRVRAGGQLQIVDLGRVGVGELDDQTVPGW